MFISLNLCTLIIQLVLSNSLDSTIAGESILKKFLTDSQRNLYNLIPSFGGLLKEKTSCRNLYEKQNYGGIRENPAIRFLQKLFHQFLQAVHLLFY